MRDPAPPLYRDIQARALDGTGGRANAVKAMCLQCCGWQRVEVAACAITDCPLWHYRPYQPLAPQISGGFATPEAEAATTLP